MQLDHLTTAAAVLGGSGRGGATTVQQLRSGVPAAQSASGLVPAATPTTALGHPVPSAVAAIVPMQLPAALERSVSQALCDLTNMRAQYPQQCAEAELAGSGMHEEAARRVSESLGGQFDYEAAKRTLLEVRQAAKSLKQDKKGGKAAAVLGLDREPPAPPGSPLELPEDFQAFAEAVKQEVAARIARARLQPQDSPKPNGRRQPPVPSMACAALKPAAPKQQQQQQQQTTQGAVQAPLKQGEGPKTNPAAARAVERKRERSPIPVAGCSAEELDASDRSATAAKQHSQPAPLPASKKAKAHIAFGTRCDPPRPAAARGARVVKLNASPPELHKPKVSKAVQHEADEPARPDMLRTLAAAFQPANPASRPKVAVADAGVQQALAEATLPHTDMLLAQSQQVPWSAAYLAPQTASQPSGSSQLQGMLQSLAAAVSTWQQQQQQEEVMQAMISGPAAAAHGASADAPGSLGMLAEMLRRRGVSADEMCRLQGLLQAVLGSMDAIAQHAERPHDAQPAATVAEAPNRKLAELEAHLAAAAAALQLPLDVLSPACGVPEACSAREQQDSAVQQLSQQLSLMLRDTTSTLQGVQQELHLAHQTEAVASAVAAQRLVMQQGSPAAQPCGVLAGEAEDGTVVRQRPPHSPAAVLQHEEPARPAAGNEDAGDLRARGEGMGVQQASSNPPIIMADSQVQTESPGAGFQVPSVAMFPMPGFVQPFLPVQQFAFAADEPTPDNSDAAELTVEFSEAADAVEQQPAQQQPASLNFTARVEANTRVDGNQAASQAASQGEQLMLDLLCAASIQQYNQVAGSGVRTLGSGDAWDDFMLGKGETAAGSHMPPCTLSGPEPLSEPLAPPPADPAEPPFNTATAQRTQAASLPPALPQPRRQAYNPFLAAQQPAAAAAQQQQHDAALESYADMLALWGDSTARPGVAAGSLGEVGPQPPPSQQQQQEEDEAVRQGVQGHAGSGIAVQEYLDTPQLGQVQELVADPSCEGKCQQEEEELPQRYQLFLWQPEYAAAEPDFFHQQHAAAAEQLALAAADAAAKLEGAASPSCPTDSPSTSDSLTDSSSSSGSSWDDTFSAVSSDCTPAAISRHRAQALHLRLMRKQLEQQLQLSGSLSLTETDSVGSPCIYSTPGSCRGAPAPAPAATLGAGAATRPYRPELYSPAAEAAALWQPAGILAVVPSGADWQQPVAWPAQVPRAAGSLLAQLAADLAPLPASAGSAAPGTAATAPASGSAAAAGTAGGCIVAAGSSGTACPGAASQPASQQAMPSSQEQAWGGGTGPSLLSSYVDAALPATNLGNHLSACSEASPSTAALTLRPRDWRATSSSCSTLAEVLSPEGSLQGAHVGRGGAPVPAVGMPSRHHQQRQHSLQQQQDAPSPMDAAVQQQVGSPATPGAACGLGDHLSDATPSEAGSSWSLKVPAAGEVVSLSLRGASSSCEEAAGAATGGAQRHQKGWGGLGALHALKSRLSRSRSAGGVGH